MPDSRDLERDDGLPFGYWTNRDEFRRDLIAQCGGEEKITPRRRILVEMIVTQYGFYLETVASLDKLPSRIDGREKGSRPVPGVDHATRFAQQIMTMISSLGIMPAKEPKVRESAIVEESPDPVLANPVQDFIAQFEAEKKSAKSNGEATGMANASSDAPMVVAMGDRAPGEAAAFPNEVLESVLASRDEDLTKK